MQLWVCLVPSPHVTHAKKKKWGRESQTDKQSDRGEGLENVNTTKILLGVVDRETQKVKSEHFKNCNETKKDFKCCKKKFPSAVGRATPSTPKDARGLIPETGNMLGDWKGELGCRVEGGVRVQMGLRLLSS